MAMENKSKALEYLGIARSTFYYSSLLEKKDEELRQKIEAVLDSNPSYGHKRIALKLKMNRKPIRRVMKKYGIKPRRKRKKPWKRAPGEESGPALIYWWRYCHSSNTTFGSLTSPTCGGEADGSMSAPSLICSPGKY
jgi:hypothetical protein